MRLLPTAIRPLLVLALLLPLAAARAASADTPAPAATASETAAPPSATPVQPQAKAKAKAKPKVRDGMVTVAGGAFFMGCNEAVDIECFADEKPGRMVEVETFQIDQKEVSVAQFARCVTAKACSSEGLTMPFYDGKEQPEYAEFCNWKKKGREQHPINCVPWSEAEAYCKWSGKRLPTEAEWEKTARGVDGRKYPWGDVHPIGVKLANVADETARKRYPEWKSTNGYDDGYLATAPVGSFPDGAAPSGAEDMVGNVWEWIADPRETGRVVRGSAWTFDPVLTRTSLRGWTDAKVRAADGGFRCAK